MLLYLVRDKETGRYTELAAGIGGRVEREHENLYWLDNLPQSLGRNRISGTVHAYQNQPFAFTDYVAGAGIRIFNGRNSFEVFTDKNGVYEIWDVPVGKYQIRPSLPPGFRLNFTLERGAVDFASPESINPESNAAAVIDIRPRGCGGVDYVVARTIP
jgi:hypothetical protein